jgi:hypothetical protein
VKECGQTEGCNEQGGVEHGNGSSFGFHPHPVLLDQPYQLLLCTHCAERTFTAID